MDWSTLFFYVNYGEKELDHCRLHGTKVVGVGNEEVFFAFGNELVQYPAMQQGGVKI